MQKSKHTHTHAYIPTSKHTYILTCVHLACAHSHITPTQTYACLYNYVCLYVCVCVCVCVYVKFCVFMRARMCACTCVCLCLYISVYVCVLYFLVCSEYTCTYSGTCVLRTPLDRQKVSRLSRCPDFPGYFI